MVPQLKTHASLWFPVHSLCGYRILCWVLCSVVRVLIFFIVSFSRLDFPRLGYRECRFWVPFVWYWVFIFFLYSNLQYRGLDTEFERCILLLLSTTFIPTGMFGILILPLLYCDACMNTSFFIWNNQFSTDLGRLSWRWLEVQLSLFEAHYVSGWGVKIKQTVPLVCSWHSKGIVLLTAMVRLRQSMGWRNTVYLKLSESSANIRKRS